MLDYGERSVTGTVHDVDEGAHVVVAHIPHESYDAYQTDFQRGAFSESFRRNQHFPMLLEHTPQLRLGQSISAQVLPKYNEIAGEFDRTPLAERGFRAILNGETKGWSFFFRNAKWVPHPDHPGGKRCVRADIEEFSAVKRPAIPGSATAGIRSQPFVDLAALNAYYRLNALADRALLRRLDRASARARAVMVPAGILPQRYVDNLYDAGTRAAQREVAAQDELEERFSRIGRRFVSLRPGMQTIDQQLAMDGVQNPKAGPNKYAASDPDRDNMFAAFSDVLLALAQELDDAELPDADHARILSFMEALAKSPDRATGAALSAALNALNPNVPQVARAKLQGLGRQVQLATNLMQPFQRLAVEGVLNQS